MANTTKAPETKAPETKAPVKKINVDEEFYAGKRILSRKFETIDGGATKKKVEKITLEGGEVIQVDV